jgi:ABC-type glycerol-3-phosphate transport system permease component
MSKPLMITLIAVTVNLGGTLMIYSLMAFCLARFHWHGRGMLAVLTTIFVAEVFWIAPTMIGFDYSIVGTSASYSLWFGNWLVSAFVMVLFCQTVKRIPRQLEDSALLDGTNWFGTYWHVVLPLVRVELGFIAVLTVMATAFPVWANLTGPGGTDLQPVFEFVRVGTYGSITTMLIVTAITSLPVIAIFFAVNRHTPPPAKLAK